MNTSIFEMMQSAVDIVATSQHPANKIAAAIAGKDADGKDFALARVNAWPEAIRDKIGTDVQIGNSSGTVHAETMCLIEAPVTDGASLFVTDPPCPNCVKNMTEAGIKNLYIDHKGWDKDFAARRGGDFQTLSLHICEKAGINVFKVFRKDKRVEEILEIPADYKPVLERPARITSLATKPDAQRFKKIITEEAKFYDRRVFATAIASDANGYFIVSAEIHAISGFTSREADLEESKYNLFLQPVHRVFMTSARHGLKIERDYLFSSRVPTARELVNMTGVGFKSFYLGDDQNARDEFGLQALKTLTDAGILSVKA